MRFIRKANCRDCNVKCDIFFTAREMGLEQELEPLHVQYRKREAICRRNEEITHAIVLLEGHAKMFMEGMNYKNIILNILMPSNYIGLISVFGLPEYNYGVAALGPCLTCHVDMGLVRKMYHGNPNFLMKLNRQFGQTVRFIMEKLVSLNQKHIRGKIAGSLIYLSELYESDSFTLTLTRRELGELSAISEENAVRVLAEFSNEGIIAVRGRELELRDREALERISLVG